MTINIDALVANAFKTLDMISGIRSDCTGGETFDQMCSKVVGTVYVELCSEFDESISNQLQEIDSKMTSINVIINKKSSDLKGSKSLKLTSIIPKLDHAKKMFDTETGAISIKKIETTPVIELQQKVVSNLAKSCKLPSGIASNVLAFNDFDSIEKELTGKIITADTVEKGIVTDYDTIMALLKEIRSQITWIRATREEVYSKLKVSKEMKERQIAYNLSLGKYQAPEASNESAKSISLLSQGYAISGSILQLYLSVITVGLSDLKKIIE